MNLDQTKYNLLNQNLDNFIKNKVVVKKAPTKNYLWTQWYWHNE